jgi:hypothetical protein
MKIINNILIFLLCVSLIGFFANFAQNDYGAVLTAICFWFIAGCFFIKAVNQLTIFKKAIGFSFLIFFLNLFINLLSEEITVIVLLVIVPTITIIYPTIAYLMQRKLDTKTNWLHYYRYLFLGLLFFGIYLKELHLIGAGVLMGICLFQVFNFIIELVYKRKEIFIHAYGIIYLVFLLDVMALFVATAFKIQHWPGSNLLFKISPYLFLFLIIGAIYSFIKKQEVLQKFTIDNKILLGIILVINMHGVLRYFKLVPRIYRNEMPAAYYEIDAKANDVTEEGRTYTKLRADFRDSYDDLYEQIQESRNE